MFESGFNVFLNEEENNFVENSIYKSCCVKLMEQWEEECVDLVVTSPPYEDFRKYQGFNFDLEETVKQLYRIKYKIQ